MLAQKIEGFPGRFRKIPRAQVGVLHGSCEMACQEIFLERGVSEAKALRAGIRPEKERGGAKILMQNRDGSVFQRGLHARVIMEKDFQPFFHALPRPSAGVFLPE